MITILIVNMNAEVKIRHYKTSSEEDACRMLVSDWKKGEIKWEWEGTNTAFPNEFLDDMLDLEFNSYSPKYENGVRVMDWYCGGETNLDDEIVWIYFIHSNTDEIKKSRLG